MKYRPDIDGMRALAVLSVMLYHLQGRWLPGGYLGVDVFFVISGFVVSGSLAATPPAGLRAYLAAFYARRLARIIPALVAMLVATAVLSALFVPRSWLSSQSERTGFAAFFGLSNWVLQRSSENYFAPRAEFNPYTHTWSLGVEEQFYLLFPLLFYFRVRARPAAGRAQAFWAALVAVLGAVSFAGCLWATTHQPAAAFYSVGYRFWELAAGAMLFQWGARAPRAAAGRWTAAGGWLGLALLAAPMLLAAPDRYPIAWAVSAVAGALLLLGGVDAEPAVCVRRLLAGAVPVWIGKRSYALYLWHWPTYVLMRWTVGIETPALQLAALAASAALAAGSYRWVERPLRHAPWLERRRTWQRIAFFLALVLLGWALARGLFLHRAQVSLSTVNRNGIDWFPDQGMPYAVQRACAVQRDSQGEIEGAGGQLHLAPGNCTMVRPAQTLYVLGDSHAEAYLPMFDALAAETGRDVRLYLKPGCAYLPLSHPMAGGTDDGCLAFWNRATAEVRRAARPGDILFLPSLRLPRFCGQWNCAGADGAGAARDVGLSERIAAARTEAAALLAPFSALRMAIVFEAPKPIFRSPTFRCADWFDRGNPACAAGTELPRALLEQLRAPIVQAQAALAQQLPGVSLWDPLPILCPTPTCGQFRAGRPLFYDADHVSGYGNALLYPSFRAAMDALPSAAPVPAPARP